MITSVLAGLTILIVGDSHMTTPSYLITTLQDGLVAQGAKVHAIGICGANAGDWTKVTPGTCGGAERIGSDAVKMLGTAPATRPIKELIAADKPDLVIVVQGDTMAAYDKPDFPKTWAWQQVTTLTKDIASTKTACAWVGPAWGTEGGKFGKNLARLGAPKGASSARTSPASN